MKEAKSKTTFLEIKSGQPQNLVIKQALQTFKNGGLVVFPTETVYGLGALMTNKKAIDKIYQLRKRPKNKALLILVSSPQMAAKYTKKTSAQVKKLIKDFWPGPLTLIFEKNKKVPNFITAGKKTVAIRMPENKFLLDLIKKLGQPIIAPSANLSGRKSPITVQETFQDFFGKVDLILDGGPTKYQKESTILDLTQQPPKILREGAISRKKLAKYIELF